MLNFTQMAPRVLLCSLNSKYIHTNLAIRLLYQLNKHRGNIWWKEFTIKQNIADIAKDCAAFDLVAFSCYIWNITPTLEVCKRIKELNPEIRILLGGPEVSYDYADLIARGEIDYIIPGEGEVAFEAFLHDYPAITEVPGLVWKSGHDVRINPPAAIFDLRKLEDVMPYADDDPETLRNKVLYIETSRGCPYKCEFCLASLDNKVRYLPQHSIESTLLFLMKHGRTIKFLDRTFNIKREFTLRIFQFILDNHEKGNVFQFEITADILHTDIIAFIKEKVPKALFRFEIGIQTVNQKANLAVSRKQNFDKTRNIVLQLRDHVEMHLDLIVGLPHDRIDDIRSSIDEVFALYPPELQLGFLKFLKGTPLREKYESHGYVFDRLPPYQIIRSEYLSETELKQITMLEDALEYFWNGQKATNTLKHLSSLNSISQVLEGIGTKVAMNGGFTALSFEACYQLFYDYISGQFGENSVAAQLAAIDYFIHYPHRPRLLFNAAAADDMPGTKAARLLISFDFEAFRENGHVLRSPCQLLFVYDGKSRAKVIQLPKPADQPAGQRATTDAL